MPSPSTSSVIIIVNVGGTSVKCSLFIGDSRQYELRVSCIGLERLVVRDDSGLIDWPDHDLEGTVRHAVGRVVDHIPTHQRTTAIVGYRVKIFRPSPVAYEVNAAAMRELACYAFLHRSHAALLELVMQQFSSRLPSTTAYILPDHAGIIGTGLFKTPPGLPAHLVRQYGLFAIPQHGYALRSAIRSVGDTYQSCPNGVVICHGGSGVSVNRATRGDLTFASMLYSSCDGPIMTYRSGSLPAGVMLRFGRGASLDEIAGLLSSGGIYSSLTDADRRQLKMADLFESSAHEDIARDYADSITSGIMEAVVRGGWPDRFIFTGGIFEHSGALLQLILGRLETILNRPIRPWPPSPEDGRLAGPFHQVVDVDEESVMRDVLADHLKMIRRDLFCQCDQDFRIWLERLAPEVGRLVSERLTDPFIACHLIASQARLIDMEPTNRGTADAFDAIASHSIYVDRDCGLFHAFEYAPVARLP